MTASRRMRAAAVLVALVLPVTAAAPASALPRSSAIAGDLAAARERLDELEGIVGVAVDDYHEARAEVEAIEGAARRTEARVARQRDEVARLRAETALHVRRLDRYGPSLQVAELVSRADPMAGGQRAVLLRLVIDRQRTDLAALEAAEVALGAEQGRLDAELAEATRRSAELEARRATIEALVAEQAEEVADLERRLRDAEAAEERARRAAEERRLRDAARAALAGSAPGTGASTAPATGTSTAPATGTAPTAPAPTAPASSRAAEIAVQAALSKLGAPYQWGATGPDAFDCSGLVVWAYAQAGVWVPRTSRDQFARLTPISREDLRPGDLVFAGDPVHHVGIYVGDGRIVHAPQTGGVVSIRSMERHDLRGFARVG